ncbi:unnamed protein product, partial [Rotaria socialis]
ILVDFGGFWWILVDSMDPGGFWWILVDSGGFYGSWWNLRLLSDTNEIEMMAHDTSSSDHTTPTAQTPDKKFKLVMKSNMVAPASIDVPSSIPVAN